MANTQQLKRRINTVNNISKITKAMEMVAASKMKRAQDQALKARAYALALSASLQKLSEIVDPRLHRLLGHHQEGKSLVILVSTEKGLCGSLNANLFKKLWQWWQKVDDPELIVIGKKAVTFAKNHAQFKLYAQFTDLPEELHYSDIVAVTSMVIEKFLTHEFRSVTLIYSDFINTLTQKTKVEQLLPLKFEEKKFIPTGDVVPGQIKKDYLFEPSPQLILDKLLPFYIENTVYHAFLESKASEHSARMVAMKNASENAAELTDELKLIFNKSRQESITKELLDISTAMVTLG